VGDGQGRDSSTQKGINHKKKHRSDLRISKAKRREEKIKEESLGCGEMLRAGKRKGGGNQLRKRI